MYLIYIPVITCNNSVLLFWLYSVMLSYLYISYLSVRGSNLGYLFSRFLAGYIGRIRVTGNLLGSRRTSRFYCFNLLFESPVYYSCYTGI